jgi:hypothetical protein
MKVAGWIHNYDQRTCRIVWERDGRFYALKVTHFFLRYGDIQQLPWDGMKIVFNPPSTWELLNANA